MMEHESRNSCHAIRVARSDEKVALSQMQHRRNIPPCSQSTQVIAVAKRGTQCAKWRRCLGNIRSIMGLDSVLFLAERFPTRARALSPKGGLVVAPAPTEIVVGNAFRIGGH